MSSSESGKSSIMKYIPEKSIELREFLKDKGIKDLERRTILVNGEKVELNLIVDKKDEIIVLPVLRGG